MGCREVVALALPRGCRPGCLYGTTGVTMVRLIRCALLKRGTRISAARTAVCNPIETASARRRELRSHASCSASPSTRHPLNDPRLSLHTSTETFSSSGDITYLHKFFCECLTFRGHTERSHRKLCGADFLGVALDLQETGAALAGM